MKKAFKVAGIMLGLLLLTGVLVYAFTPKEKINSFLIPDLDNIRVTDVRINEDSATMHVVVNVSPKLIPAFVDSLDYDFRLYGQSVAQGSKSFEQETRQGWRQTLTIPISMNHNKTRELVRRQVAEGEKVNARVKAYCTIPILGHREFDIDEKVEMIIPALPGAEITHINITDLGLDNMEMTMTMVLDNPNSFDFYIREMKMDVQLKDYMTSVGGTDKDYLVKARSKTPIKIPATSDAKKPLKAGFKILAGEHVLPYTMKSYMVLEPRNKVVGTIHMDAVKTGTINVVRQMKKLKEVKEAEKEQAEKQE